MWTLLSTHAKEAIRLKADIETLGVDLRQLLEAGPVDRPEGEAGVAGHGWQGSRSALGGYHRHARDWQSPDPEQQQKLRAMRRSMMGHGGMMGGGGMDGPGEVRKNRNVAAVTASSGRRIAVRQWQVVLVA